ncbi:MAG: metallophosphoesterase [Nitrospinota bacterium]|nr:MAG: metallophosphoesterase [Nitrospinota bacterium]
MRILTVSDYVVPALYDHFKPERFPDIQLILSCGDLPPEYLTFLVTMFNVPLFYVRGNHDIQYDQNPPEGCEDIDGRLVIHRGIRILGLEGSRWYNGKPHQYTEREMWWKIRRVRPKIWWHGGVDIIITHAPPRHIHDAEDQCHRGFEGFRYLIERYAPRYFIHGHMHFNYTTRAQRITRVNSTEVINSYGYYLLEIEADQRMAAR